MDTMRRLLSSLTALGLLSAVIGCEHTAGCCDCVGPGDPCCYAANTPGNHVVPVGHWGHGGWDHGAWEHGGSVEGAAPLAPSEPAHTMPSIAIPLEKIGAPAEKPRKDL